MVTGLARGSGLQPREVPTNTGFRSQYICLPVKRKRGQVYDWPYHLMVQTPEANLSRCMRDLNGVYTQKYNLVHGCDGTLFRGRYKSILVDADSYVLQLVRYIHHNPLDAGLVNHLDRYGWSSHKGYISKAKKGDWLYKDFVLKMLTEHESSQIRVYKRFIVQQHNKDIVRVFECRSKPSMIGNKEFISWVKDKFFKKKIDR